MMSQPTHRKVAVHASAADGREDETVPIKELGMDSAAVSNSESSLVPVLSAVFIASVGSVLFGYHLGVVNGPLEAIGADLGIAGNPVLQGSVVSTLLAGAAGGALCGGPLADRIGRKMALAGNSLFLITGALLSASATSLNYMLLGRLIAGIGIGVSSGVVPLYISEISPTAIRGALGSVNQLCICLGILAALLVNVVLEPVKWQSMFALAVIPAAVLGLGMLLCPESPRWLSGNGKNADASSVMMKLWGKVEPIKDAATATAEKAGVALNVNAFRILAIGCSLFLFQQFSGINAIIYFSSKVFQDAGMKSGAIASAGVGAINVLGTLFATGLMDRAGRMQLLTYSYLGMGISMLAMAAGFSLPALASLSVPIALLGTLGYILSFGLGVGPVPALIVPEISPPELRGRALSFALTTHWVANFGIGQLFLPALANFGVTGVYLFFSAVCFAAIAFSKKFLVETKGRSLEEIAKEMS